MLVTAYTVAYLLLSALSIFIGFVALWSGLFILSKWKHGASTDEQYSLEKKGYLVITAIVLGTAMRVAMLPLWFLTLHSYIPSVPGAMCLAGIHMLKPSHSFIATGLKFILPLFYIFWLVLNRLDRQMEEQPLYTFKLKSLLPLGILMGIETYFDWIFLRSVEPRQVTCCSLLFDLTREEVPRIMESNVWLWYILFVAVTVILVLAGIFVILNKERLFDGSIRAPARNGLIAVTTVLGIADIVLFTLAVHTKISPLFLHAPFHHCIFCVYYTIWDGALFNALIIVGIWFSLVNSWVMLLAGRRRLPASVAATNTVRLALVSVLLLFSGLLVVLLHTAFAL